MNTQLSQKTSSRTFQTNISLSILEVVLLTLIGAIGVLIHARFRLGLGMPGHWGLIYMALLFSGRLSSKRAYASSLSSLGAVAMLLLPIGFKDPFMPVLYMFPGLFMDMAFNVLKNRKSNVIICALISGLAYMCIPLARIIISLTFGYTHTSIIAGSFYPLIMHFVFGALGGLIALGVFTLIKKKI